MDRKRILAWSMLLFALISWPLASLTFAKTEPPFVIALSELALIYTAAVALLVEDKYRTPR